MGLQTREIGERTIVWFDRLTKSVDIGPACRPLLWCAHFLGLARIRAWENRLRSRSGGEADK